MPRLYKPKNVPKQHPNPLDAPSGPPSSSPGSSTPHGLKRAAEAVSKQISGHKAMVAQFKEMRLPRPTMFSTKSATPPHTDRSLSTKQSNPTNSEKPPQAIPSLAKSPTSSVNPKQRAPLSRSNTNSRSPTRPPGLGFEKAPTTPVKKAPTPLSAPSAPSKSKSVQSRIHSPRQRVGASTTSATSPTNLASTGTNLASISVPSASDEADVDKPILFVSCWYSAEEDAEQEDDLFETVELSSGLGIEAQVAEIFGRGLGPASDTVVRYGEAAPPKATPEATIAPTLDPMSAVVEQWEPASNMAISRSAAVDLNSQGRSNEFETTSQDKKQVVCVSKNIPHQPPSSSDYEYLSLLGRDAFGALSLGIHKQSRRICVVKVISNVIVEEQMVVRAVLEEQRIMREASNFPFLLGLMASFHDANGFYLVSVSFFVQRAQ